MSTASAWARPRGGSRPVSDAVNLPAPERDIFSGSNMKSFELPPCYSELTPITTPGIGTGT